MLQNSPRMQTGKPEGREKHASTNWSPLFPVEINKTRRAMLCTFGAISTAQVAGKNVCAISTSRGLFTFFYGDATWLKTERERNWEEERKREENRVILIGEEKKKSGNIWKKMHGRKEFVPVDNTAGEITSCTCSHDVLISSATVARTSNVYSLK